MNADGIEHLVGQEVGEFDSSVDSVHENDDLVEGQIVQKMGEFLELLALDDERFTSGRVQ